MPDTPSEYGGYPGLIQPESTGHVPTADERHLLVLKGDDPADPASGVDVQQYVTKG